MTLVALWIPSGISQIMLVTLKSDYEGDFFHFRLTSPQSYVFKALYADHNWAGRFRGKGLVKEFVNIKGEQACKSFSVQRRTQVKGRVVLIERGGCKFFLQGHNCQEAGAYACFIFDPAINKDTKDVEMFLTMAAADEDIAESGPVDVPVAYLRRQDALYIQQLIQEDGVTGIQLNLNSSKWSLQEQPTWSLW